MDARAQRSRTALHDAVLDLARTVAVEQLTATRLSAAAGVHRSTFYEHAASPEDLLRQALLAELDALRADLLDDVDHDTDAAVVETTRRVLEHVLRHVEIYRRGLADDGSAGLHGMLSEHFLGSSRQLLEQGRIALPSGVDGVPDPTVADAALRWVALGTVGVIRAWIDQDAPTVDGFMRLYGRLMPSWWTQPGR